ncbi:MAG TPA: mechanosensitive ion channel family protein [Alphaproteobacteria bacterium]|nr:mechanosensitive ion channel family protein [Alphaproteobacteria bacterium]
MDYTHFYQLAEKIVPGIALGILVFAGLLTVRRLMARWLEAHNRTRHLTSGWSDLLLHAVNHTYLWFLLMAGVFVAVENTAYAQRFAPAVEKIFVALLFIQAGLWVSVLLREWAFDYIERYRKVDSARIGLVNSLVRLGYMTIWIVIVLLALDNFGVNVTALVAGLGVGGVAVAFALQNILQDMFASFSIVFDKPFVIGDFIITNDYMGTIEQIGMKTTRVRSLSGEQIIIANSDLLGSRIRNYGRMRERRVVFALGVEYDTPPKKLERIPAMVREAVERQENTRFDRCNWINYGAYSLDFETVFFMTVPDNNQMIATREKIFLDIYRQFAREKINFAFPTQVEIRRPETAGEDDDQDLN